MVEQHYVSLTSLQPYRAHCLCFHNKVLLEHSHVHSFLVCDGLPATMAEVNSHDGGFMVHKA